MSFLHLPALSGAFTGGCGRSARAICTWKASVWGDGEGLTLPETISVEVQYQASSLCSSRSKRYPPFSTLLCAQKSQWTSVHCLCLWFLFGFSKGRPGDRGE